jgi:hypothetical protein
MTARHGQNLKTYRRITLFRFISLAREHDQPFLIRLQSLDIDQLSLLTQIPPPMIHHNPDTFGFLLLDTSRLELRECESPALPDPSVVTYGLCSDSRPEERQGADTESSRFGLSGFAASEFATGLVKPGADAPLPVFAEVVRVKD